MPTVLQTYVDGESDLSVRTKINNNAQKIDDALTQFAILEDVKGNGIDAGAFNSGAWRTRTINNISENSIIGLSLSSNQFTIQPGKYEIEASAPAYIVERHQIRLRNITDNVTTKIGTSEYTNNIPQSRSELTVTLTIISPKTFELQHYCTLTRLINGFGVNNGNSDGTGNIYAYVKIRKLLS